MPDKSRRASSSAAFSFLLLVSAVLIFAPLFRAGNRPLPLLVLELLALAIFMLFVVYRRAPWDPLGRGERLALGVIVAIPLVSLVPLPAGWWGALPGRGPYVNALSLFGEVDGMRTISVISFATQASMLALLPPLAVFLGTLACGDRERLRLVYVLLAIATAEALLGLCQYGTQDVLFYLGMDPSAAAQGTYPNRNHFSGLFEMAFPLAAALFAAGFGKNIQKSRRYRGKGVRAAFARMGEARVNIYMLFLLLLALFGLAIVFSRSRTGIALLILGVVISALAFALRLGGRKTLGTVGGVTVLLASAALAIGLVPVLQRFAESDPVADSRWSIALATVEGIGTFFPVGSGMGSYPDVMRRFHPADIGLFINHAHNDYLEWLFEGGAFAGGAILLMLVLFIRRCASIAREEAWPRERYLRIGAAIGIFLIFMHGFVEYNLRIPANAIFFAFLMGLLFSPSASHEPVKDVPRKPARERRPDAPKWVPPPAPQPEPDASNPFAR